MSPTQQEPAGEAIRGNGMTGGHLRSLTAPAHLLDVAGHERAHPISDHESLKPLPVDIRGW